MKSAAIAAAVLAVATGCGGRAERQFQTDAAHARAAVAAGHREWFKEVRANARLDPTRRFPNLSRPTFERRLRAAAARYRLTVESIVWRRVVQSVPEVVVSSDDYDAAARDLPRLMDAIDPPPRSNARAFEAIYIEAVDSHDVPYIAIFDALRDHVMGGEWARDESLYPFPHG
ncbi:MAG TPA: hypothetical protein VGK79_04540 [Gaiellaceae bacterium]